MKKTIILLIFSISVFQSLAQKNEKAPKSKSYYQHKSDRQKTAGWVLLVGGSVLTVMGISNITQEDDNPFIDIAQGFAGTFVALAGAGLTIGGISTLSSSRKNAKKAAQISFNNQRYQLPAGNLVAVKMQPTVTVRIPLGYQR
jgi:Trk-type K+ transport system membrane component